MMSTSLKSLATLAFAAGLGLSTDAPAIKKRCTRPTKAKLGKSFDCALIFFFEKEDRSRVTADPNFHGDEKEGHLPTASISCWRTRRSPSTSVTSRVARRCVMNDSSVNFTRVLFADELEAAASAVAPTPRPSTAAATRRRVWEPLADEIANEQVPQFAFFAPDLLNDSHNTNTYAGKWLGGFYSKYERFFTGTNTVFHLVFDETGSYTTANSVYSVMFGGTVDSSKNCGRSSLQSANANAVPFAGTTRHTQLCG
ncbi:hypothetical protein K437DRAFT_271594 [Tilletiaria anomala UBC 951]|uniref:Uncharacterized protein n=1 Tax=Tilletiaria anomala (strain ATCC 24038 / CBS 436.72 / UBC 951) TaxID=1037660 RepID=A0A066WHB7_TILAU|nr:uncharacterized protein K437DRAFT_271594 [Tilletiaria anomala UBC 951]KDN53362.1 hypothetical protein K437DRAFT_271594 [Tilletiaria anomala UBC 951]